ncbi:hypothetical protein IHE49_13690 [Rhodanobacter sp. 7MK24]|uniref:hypothetical protein n=1 Tax=Rhodanobacter sp. 7MK24 TaxID=2775922 RepID=UPI001780C612|nr:hypothetical protein [Rhodanobacter sp. 7MK24]MBD8881535.1 hypothetical protein [Rhodanobacter sp. 7MK24]
MTNSPARPVPSRLKRARHVALAVTLLGCLIAGAIHAQDEVAVSDQTVRNNTNSIKTNTSNISNQLGGSTSSGSTDTVNGHLKNIDTLGAAPSNALSTVTAPDSAVNPDSMVSTPTDNSATACNGVASGQQGMCQNIIKAKVARFNYMKAMYDSTLKLQTALTNLQNARQQIGAEEFGKLQDNSNQILAIIAQLQIDRQQMESVNLAYLAYIDDQQNQQTQLAKSATEPSGDSIISNIASQAIAGAVLQGALSVQSSGTSQPLSIEKSSGW